MPPLLKSQGVRVMSENKLSKKYIGTDQVGSSQLELENNSSLRSKDSLGVSVDVLKVDTLDNLQILKSPFLPGDATEALQATAKQQVALLDGSQTMTANLPFQSSFGPSSEVEIDGMLKKFNLNDVLLTISTRDADADAFGASVAMSQFSSTNGGGIEGFANIGLDATSLSSQGGAGLGATVGGGYVVLTSSEQDGDIGSTTQVNQNSIESNYIEPEGLILNSFRIFRVFNSEEDQASELHLSAGSTDVPSSFDVSVTSSAGFLQIYRGDFAPLNFSSTQGGSSSLSLYDDASTPSMPTSPANVTTKAYVDQEISDISTDISALQNDVNILIGQVSSLQSDVADLIAADIAIDGRLDTAESNISTLQGQMSTANSNISTLQGQMTTVQNDIIALDLRVDYLEQYAENIVHVDAVNGVDAVGRGSIMFPYKTINYAYSQVSSAASNLSQWSLEKLVIQLAPGDYAENVEIGLKRARVSLIGEGVYINGTVTQTWQVSDIPYSGSPTAPINIAAIPAPYTNFPAPTFEIASLTGGMEGGDVAKSIMIAGLVKIVTVPWASNSTWQQAGTILGFFFTNHAKFKSGFSVTHDITTYPSSLGAAITCEINDSSIEGGYFGVAPFASGQQLTSSNTACACTLKASNSQLKSTLGPRLSIAKIDNCRILNMDRTMGTVVTNGEITGQNSSSFSGIVNSPFAGSIYKIGRSSGATAVFFKMDANSYADLQTKTIDTGTAAITYNLIDKASGVAVTDPATNYTRTANTVEASLEGIDTALGQLLKLDGTRAMTGALNMGTFKIGSMADPTLAQDAATKAYVDSKIASGTDYEVQKVTLSASDITNQYIDLAFKASLGSIVCSSERVNLIIVLGSDADADFQQDNSGAVTRLSFQGPSASAGDSPLADGQIIYFNYVKA